MNLEQLFERIPFLQTLNAERQEQIAQRFGSAPDWVLEAITAERVEAGTIFIRERESAETVYFVCGGTVKATDYRIYGITYDYMIVQNRLYAYGGMETILKLQHYRSTMQAVTACYMLKLPRSLFEKWIMQDIDALKLEAQMVAEYLQEETRNNRAFLFLQGSDRMALLLVNRYDQYAVDGLLQMNDTRKEFSDATGLSVKTINRSVKKFCETDMLTQKGRKLTINAEQYQRLRDTVTAILTVD